MERAEEKKYEALSPFELKNRLARCAASRSEHMMLDAGRGNPNWVATTPREAFFQLGLFAVLEAKRMLDLPDLGGSPDTSGSSARFLQFLGKNKGAPGIAFLSEAHSYACTELGLDADEFTGEMVDAILGDHYPSPDRMLKNATVIVRKYLEKELYGGSAPGGQIELFAVEGGTAAMSYLFNSLVENRLLRRGDRIAIGAPIFTPYLEIPRLGDYQLVEMEMAQDEELNWQYPDCEIEKLADQSVKALFLVNPSNPTSVSMAPGTLEKVADLVRTRRKDLIIITDDVYCSFVDGFRSLAAIAPLNTILVYSFSKFFGATGWRLGVIAIHENTVLDRMVAALPEAERLELDERYSRIVPDPSGMKFIERMVADSRSVALHHTAGLSTPQQVMMSLLSLFSLVDQEDLYRKAAQSIVRNRFSILCDALRITPPENEYSARYYHTIDVPSLARERYGEDFSRALVEMNEPIDFIVRLAEEKSIVLLDGGGFDAPKMSVRVSLANLDDQKYAEVGRAINELLDDYYRQWRAGI